MNDWITELMDRFHRMFAPCFDFSCGTGWQTLITDLVEKLDALSPDITVVQVKEKFGALRFYIEQCPESVFDEAERLISEAEHLSARTCEVCGQPGKVREGGWLITLCDDCEVRRGS